MSTHTTTLIIALRRALVALMRFTLTLCVLAGVGFVVFTARGALEVRADAREVPDAAPATPVVAARIEMLSAYQVERTFSGEVEARQQTNLAFELAGVIQNISVREGDFVEAGQPVATLDTRLLQAERSRLLAQRDAIRAQVELARRTNQRQAELLDRGFASGQTVDNTSLALVQLEAEISALDAAIEIVEINLSKSELTAPFDGYVSARIADLGTVVAGGAPVIEMLERAAPRFRVGLDPALAAFLEVGQPARVVIAGQSHDVILAHLSPDLDPGSRTRIAFFEFSSETPPPATRETGEITLTASIADDGAWVPLSALRQGPRGTWTLMVVRDDDLIVEAAELVHLGDGAAFVRGTFRDGDLFVPGGTHRVVPGQRIDVTEVVAWAL